MANTKNIYENDRLYQKHNDLVNDPFRGWYMKLFYFLPAPKINRIAAGIRSKYPPDDVRGRRIAFAKALKRALNAKYQDSERGGGPRRLGGD